MFNPALGAVTNGVPTLIADFNSGKPAGEVFADTAINARLGALFGATSKAYGVFPQIGTLAYQQLLARGGLIAKLAPYFAAASKLLNPAAAAKKESAPGSVYGEGYGIPETGAYRVSKALKKSYKGTKPIPDAKDLRPQEQETAGRMMDIDPRLKLKQYPTPAYEYIDQTGQVYDQIGVSGASLHWNQVKIYQAINNHIYKSNCITVIDLTFFTPAQEILIKSMFQHFRLKRNEEYG